jgi:hypothetical protein
MIQKYPLLQFRSRMSNEEKVNRTDITYNVSDGFWESEDHKPIVVELFNENKDNNMGLTIITETREGTDRSERTVIT